MIYRKMNGDPMTTQQVRAYLDRIHMEAPQQPDFEYLAKLQMAHVTYIPFENLDMMNNVPLIIDREHLFDKIIVQKRGGVCSELNTLYNWLLESLGYDVVSYASRVIAKTAPLQARSHRIIGVRLDGRTYLTDVGCNFEHCRIPIALEADIEQDDGECVYKLVRDEFFGWVMWQKRPGMEWRRKVGFTEEPQIDMDFVQPTFFAQNHPDSRINKYTKVSRYKDGIFYAIRDGKFLKESGGVEEVICEIKDKEHEQQLLHDIFDL